MSWASSVPERLGCERILFYNNKDAQVNMTEVSIGQLKELRHDLSLVHIREAAEL